jgi:uncharacterized protein (DUF1330 family)
MTATPVYLVVIGTVTDPVRMGAYAKALAESGLYPKHGGHYLALGQPVTDLENWPTGQSCVVAQFPDKEAAEAFWRSDQYQNDIKPLRDGAGTFHVGLFPAFAFPGAAA